MGAIGFVAISVSLNNGDGTLQPAVTYTMPNESVSLAVGDLKGDGTLDLVSANPYNSDVLVFLRNGTFQSFSKRVDVLSWIGSGIGGCG